jgi:threonylcarbamoyladenosine tRNA methylthiotransferase MtaB
MNQYKRVAFHTLGCKLNFSETSTIARSFRDAGYARVELEDNPNVLVINTCSVTDQADKKCRNIVSRAIRKNPGVFVTVIGCYAQLKPDEIVAIEGVNLVLGANEKFNIVEHVEQYQHHDQPEILAGEIKDVKSFIPSYSKGDRTRTFLKVQDGCNYFCAFCTIPLARGRSRSATIEETLVQAKEAIASGAKEIVLTGVNIGDFGTAHGETFFELVQQLDQLEGVERYRISSIEPNLLTDDIIRFVAASKKFMPHFHIPLQSGSDSILQMMRRRYRTELYKNRIAFIKELMPDACIGVDIIVGFPGESDALFLETQQFLSELPASYFHVFTYSERDNTTALRIQDVVPMEKRYERNKILRIMSEKKKRAFYEENLENSRPVLWESEQDENMINGFTDNYIKVRIPWQNHLPNSITNVKLSAIDADCNATGTIL